MSFIKQPFLRANAVLYESRRFRAKINLKRPQLPHYPRKLALEVCKPIYPRRHVWEVCKDTLPNKYKIEIHNPFQEILAKECLNWFKHSRVVAFLHINPIKSTQKFPVVQDLKIEHFHIRRYGKKVMEKALIGTVYEPCLSLYVSHNEIIFTEHNKVDVLLKILKKAPQLVLLAGIIDGKLLSRKDFVEYAELPSIDIVRSRLCNVMQSCGSSLVQQLTQHQMSLVNNLDQYVKLKESENPVDSNQNETPVEPVLNDK